MNGKRYWVMCLVLAGAILGMRMLSHGETIVLEKPLSLLPQDLDGWHGTDFPLDQKIVDAVAVSDYIARIYQKPSSGPLALYVGYYRSQRTGQTIHSPKNCLPGAGWQPVEANTIVLHPAGMKPVEVNLYVIEKGLERELVIYWYQSHGRVIASEYAGKFYMVADAVRMNRTDSALVRVATPMNADPAAARRNAVEFTEHLLPELNKLIPQ